MNPRPRAIIAMNPPTLAENLFGPHRERLRDLVDVSAEVLTEFDSRAAARLIEDVEILLAGWGCPRVDQDLLDRMPNLRAVVFAGGAASAVLDTGEATRRGIVFTNAGEGNAQAVAEYTAATIVLAGKRARYAEQLYREGRKPVDREAVLLDSGNFGRTVGLIGASRIGRRVAQLLQSTDLRVLIYDPYATAEEAVSLGGVKVDLDDLLAASDIVSLHAPATAETDHMIGAHELDVMRDGAVLINTARGSLIDHDALRGHLRAGRIDAILDVTEPEPLAADDELWSLPNVTLTPHIAGATGNELHRLGRDVVDEVARYVAGHAFVGFERVPGVV
ncbi:hydroxyacid dehydrogenase [Microbacterium sp. SA39]|uniref:hydroxyacid dehydrogenase n=1 Tax=Microbacterium sp. SA39 TaxID=1263625 RepID=UPI00061F3AF9|nr:hydroxyacid dehydrogenase [Microbacterium sp. SA39]KJQ52661.1 putative 2-hydroxyacid dehydrogenase YoaD [Microbacterium sp. SA39]